MTNPEKVVYAGIEDIGLTYGGEYPVVRNIQVCCKLLGYVVVGDDDKEHFISVIDTMRA